MLAPPCSNAALVLRVQHSVIIPRKEQGRSGSRLLNLYCALGLTQGWNLHPASEPVAISADTSCFPQRVDLLFAAEISTRLQSRAVHLPQGLGF